MNGSKGLKVFCALCVWLLASLTVAQEKKQADGWLKPETAKEFVGGTAEQWVTALIDSREMLDSILYSDRLSFFYLAPDQIARLKTAAEQEPSDQKRLLLWHAIRQSRDIPSRNYLIQNLVENSSVDLQIQFIDGLRNPSRYDIPILVALYNSHRPSQKRTATAASQPSITSGKKSKSSQSLRVGETSNSKTSQADTQNQVDSQKIADLGNQPEIPVDSFDPTKKVGDLFDIPQKIVDLTCQVDWQQLIVMTGWTYPGGNVDLPHNAKWLEITGQRRDAADRAHEEMVHWLIKSGFDDSHRVSAFQAYLTDGTFRQRRRQDSDMGKTLLRGLKDPASKAKAIRLVSIWAEPSQFLADEDEIVRLGAIDAMQGQVIDAFSAWATPAFVDKVALYKPFLEQVQLSDPSDKVKAAAKRLQNLIAEKEKEFLQETRRAK